MTLEDRDPVFLWGRGHNCFLTRPNSITSPFRQRLRVSTPYPTGSVLRFGFSSCDAGLLCGQDPPGLLHSLCVGPGVEERQWACEAHISFCAMNSEVIFLCAKGHGTVTAYPACKEGNSDSEAHWEL